MSDAICPNIWTTESTGFECILYTKLLKFLSLQKDMVVWTVNFNHFEQTPNNILNTFLPFYIVCYEVLNFNKV